MGAKMIPITKKRGRTVFGVRIGLRQVVSIAHIRLCAGSMSGEDVLPGLESLLSKGRVYDVCIVSDPASTGSASPSRRSLRHSLAGRRLFFLSGLLGAES
jgi:hypothetical protein